MKSIQEMLKEKPWLGWVLFALTVVVVFFLGLLASSIVERRSEAVFAYTPEAKFSQFEPRNEKWGELFPREYNTYMKTSDTTFRSKYNGSAMVDMLEESPEMVVLWAGYLFSRDYNQGRGNAMIKNRYASTKTHADGRHCSPQVIGLKQTRNGAVLEQGPQNSSSWLPAGGRKAAVESTGPRLSRRARRQARWKRAEIWSATGPSPRMRRSKRES